ncbi:hypothetical protein LLS04_04395 [Erysipelothrix enhydrae]|uniref:hypothetical protein n=1 Tax=Erysipelothrix enhydrae TaxID=2890314 RepID=UPI002B24BDE9|nr:hypothetical protein [Erysipelothrix sp. 4322-04]WRB86220.1 hypothetical protein LLS04_04395 [Erysipelothrix sp. 4322-04]
MDKALELRIARDNNVEVDYELYLAESKLVKSILKKSITNNYDYVWKILALSEIPFSSSLIETKDLIVTIKKKMFTEEGMSVLGSFEEIVPCYNAMIAEAFIKLGLWEDECVKVSIEWILKYQLFERGTTSKWSGSGVEKYGGCLKKTPCFIGVCKTLKTLLLYRNASKSQDSLLNKRIEEGISYFTKHNLYQRLSTKDPINKYMVQISFPQSYVLSPIDILETAFLAKLINTEIADSLICLLEKKKVDGFFITEYNYTAKGFTAFDKKGKPALWSTYIINYFLKSI